MADRIVVSDYRHRDERGKPWPDGKGRRVFKIRQRRFSFLTKKGEVKVDGGFYDDVQPVKFYNTPAEANQAL